jgi:putative FmdB family regulatory protein
MASSDSAMPIHAFLCRDCGENYTDLVFGEQLPTCPKCASQRAEKQFSTFAVHGRAKPSASVPPPGACGTCGDPRGPGSCST